MHVSSLYLFIFIMINSIILLLYLYHCVSFFFYLQIWTFFSRHNTLCAHEYDIATQLWKWRHLFFYQSAMIMSYLRIQLVITTDFILFYSEVNNILITSILVYNIRKSIYVLCFQCAAQSFSIFSFYDIVLCSISTISSTHFHNIYVIRICM